MVDSSGREGGSEPAQDDDEIDLDEIEIDLDDLEIVPSIRADERDDDETPRRWTLPPSDELDLLEPEDEDDRLRSVQREGAEPVELDLEDEPHPDLDDERERAARPGDLFADDVEPADTDTELIELPQHGAISTGRLPRRSILSRLRRRRDDLPLWETR